MSYARPLETGSYIWSNGEYMNFNNIAVSENDIDIFLAKIYDTRYDELMERVQHGRELIKQNCIEVEGE